MPFSLHSPFTGDSTCITCWGPGPSQLGSSVTGTFGRDSSCCAKEPRMPHQGRTMVLRLPHRNLRMRLRMPLRAGRTRSNMSHLNTLHVIILLPMLSLSVTYKLFISVTTVK